MHGIVPPIKPLCKVIFTPNDGWSSADAVDFLEAEIDTHGMFTSPYKNSLAIPMDGIYVVIVNINYAGTGSVLESEWGVQVLRGTRSLPAWGSSQWICRVYTGYGAYNGQFAQAMVNLRQGDFIALTLLPSGRSTNINNSTNTGLRASHLIVQYIAPSLPNRSANGTTYDIF